MRVHRIRTWAAGLPFMLAACSPAWDWREVALPDTPLRVSFPCRPASHARRVPLAGQPLELTLHACESRGVTFAVGWVDAGDPARTGAVLAALAGAAAANLRAVPAPLPPLAFAGMTPHPASGRFVLRGPLADGQPGQARVAVFAVGTRAFQATALGAQLPAEQVDTFFDSIGVRP